jgi:microcystin-dependent protein
MPLEAGTTIADLNPSNPAHSDPLSQADAHARLIKACIVNTFHAINGVVDITDEQLNELAAGALSFADGAALTPSLRFLSEPTLGFYRASAKHIGIAGRIDGNGAVRCGAVEMFLVAPSSFGTSSTPGTTYEWLELNGAVYPVADYPDLGPKIIAQFGTTFGGNGSTTFGLPNMYDTGRFPRSRSASLALGTTHANQNKSHSHTASTGAAGAHNHGTHVTDPGHQHQLHTAATNAASAGGPTIPTASFDPGNSTYCGITDTAFTGISVSLDAVGDHSHTVTVNVDGGTEARPEDIVFIFAVKS